MTAPVRAARRPSGAALLVLAAALTALLALVVVGARGHEAPLTPRQQAHQVAAQLRCPVCRDLSVADSPSPLATQMREQIAEQLRAGRTPQQVRDHFVAAYGETVLMTPPHHGAGQLAYALPVLLLVAGAVGAGLLLRRWRSRVAEEVSEPAPLSAPDRRRVQLALRRWREEDGRWS